MNWLNTPVAAALARTLLHFVWEGALIAALLAVMLAALRRSSAQARYLAASAAMLAMVASFTVTLLGTGPGLTPVPGPSFSLFATSQPVQPGWAGSVTIVSPLGAWAVAAWLGGIVILLLRRAGGWLTARRMVARASVAAQDLWVNRLDTLRRRVGIARAVALVESALAQTPAVIGSLRPVILVPAGWLMALPADQVEAILLHELAHVRRHDYLMNLLQSIVEDLLFYHPAVWWAGRVMRRERENCCDDAVVTMGGDRRSYARTLASLEGLRAGDLLLAASGGTLAERIRRLLRPPQGPRASAAPLLLAMVLVCAGAAALPAWQSRPPAPEPTPEQARRAEQLRRELETPYEKWLTQDAAYIITREERDAFRRLQTDEEREHFIEQFWQRRGTPFKEEHYRRIAYANQHFAGDVPGWKTDMGRIYITYGPPDEKESHPTGKAGEAPYEEWLYHKLEGIGVNVIVRFEDTGRDGHFRMQKDPHALHGQAVPPQPRIEAPIQANGDRLYRSGDASVRVGEFGATLISVAASDVRITMSRISGGDGDGELVLRESASVPGIGYTKLLVLKPGQYRLQAELAGESPQEQQQRQATRKFLETALEKARSAQIAARQMYTEKHPRVLELQTQLENLQTRLAYFKSEHERARANAPTITRLEFRVP